MERNKKFKQPLNLKDLYIKTFPFKKNDVVESGAKQMTVSGPYWTVSCSSIHLQAQVDLHF